MRKKLLIAASLLTLAPLARADQVTFSFVGVNNVTNMTASAGAGLMTGPALNIAITDTTTGVTLPLSGIFTSSTGPATLFAINPSLVLATFSAGGTDSVEIVDPVTKAALIRGDMRDSAALLAHIPGGTGSFSGTFDVTDVNSTVLALFGLTSFNPNGSVSFTFGQDELLGGTTLSSIFGGGSVTFVGAAPAPTVEASTFILLGTGLLFIGLVRRRQGRQMKLAVS